MIVEADRAIFIERAGVSRETINRFDVFAELLKKWNPTINLVAPGTVKDLWSRHFLDSLAVWEARPPNWTSWIDLGTGGGFPGLVVAILAAELKPGTVVNCVEVDIRKATFLRNVSRETGVKVGVHTKRVEMLPPQSVDVLSARALSSLPNLLSHAERHLDPNGTALFQKGANHQGEIDEALANWNFSIEKVPSITDPDAALLKIKDITRV